MSDDRPQRPGQGPEEPTPGVVLAAGVVVYGAMGSAGLFWLWLRDRFDVLAERAIGQHGPFAAAGVGLCAGLIGAVALWALARRYRGIREIAAVGQRMFSRAGEGVSIAFVLISAVAEELFFRLAVQDAFGLIGSVAVYMLVNSSVGGIRWLGFTFVHALVLGTIVDQGFGLLGSTSAHAIVNYLTLRRTQDS